MKILTIFLLYISVIQSSSALQDVIKSIGNLSPAEILNQKVLRENRRCPKPAGLEIEVEDGILRKKVVAPDPTGKIRPILCPKPEEKELKELDYSKLISKYNLEFYPDQQTITSSNEFKQFVFEFKKFPQKLLRQMAKEGGTIRLVLGEGGVGIDPDHQQKLEQIIQNERKYFAYHRRHTDPLKYSEKKLEKKIKEIRAGYLGDAHGRESKNLAGLGGVFMNRKLILPTRIHLNHLYQRSPGHIHGHSSSNLFLHEHAHALDNMYRKGTISESTAWISVTNDPKVKVYLEKILSSEDLRNNVETFAELFSFYHSCDASRSQMEQEAPALAKFLRELKSIKKYRKI